MRKLLLSVLILLMIPVIVHADEAEDDYRWDAENHFYEVGEQYELIGLHFVLFTMDAAFTESDDVRDEWTNQIDDEVASELHDFFSEDELTGSDYNDRVLDYLETNFEIEANDESEGGFFAAIANFFRSIFNFFANLF